MKKYLVRLYYSTFVDIEVEDAQDVEDAIETAHLLAEDGVGACDLMDNMQESADPDVKEIEEDD